MVNRAKRIRSDDLQSYRHALRVSFLIFKDDSIPITTMIAFEPLNRIRMMWWRRIVDEKLGQQRMLSFGLRSKLPHVAWHPSRCKGSEGLEMLQKCEQACFGCLLVLVLWNFLDQLENCTLYVFLCIICIHLGHTLWNSIVSSISGCIMVPRASTLGWKRVGKSRLPFLLPHCPCSLWISGSNLIDLLSIESCI